MSFEALMQFIPAMLTGGGAGMEYGANRSAAGGSRVAAQRQAAALQFQAAQARQNAGQEIAAGQQDAAEQQRQIRLMNSRALALAAASGAGATDPTIVKIISNNAGEGAYRAAVSMYKGEERARAMRMEAAARDYDARMAVEDGERRAGAYDRAAVGSIFKGAASLAMRYGYDKPKVNDGGGKWTSGADLPTGDTWASNDYYSY
jgi:hypothetical protein